jgi:serine/threonine protein kinase
MGCLCRCCCKKKRININNISPLINKNIPNFKQIKVLGKGKFGKVFLVENIETKKLYAMKRIKKSDITDEQLINQIKDEQKILKELSHPFILKLHYSYQDNQNLYLITDFMQGGDLHNLLSKAIQLKENKAKFYLSEILLGLEYIHKNNLIYRDLKPENILIDKDGHIKISDFGLSKILNDNNNITYTLCGTSYYKAPEINLGKGYNKMCDFWSFGIIMFEMICGFKPFDVKNGNIIIDYDNLNIKFIDEIKDSSKDLILKLLVVNPEYRLGFNSIDDIKKHDFFKGIDFNKVFEKKEIPPFIPQIQNDFDLKYFNSKFTSMELQSFDSETILNNNNDNKEFEGFSYYED